jgi:hypothetical protein
MAENPHYIEKEIHGTFSTELLTGATVGNFADRIVNLNDHYPTGDRQNQGLYDRMIKEYYRRLDNMGFANFQTDLTDAGFSPKTITGFFDLATNGLLVNFFSSGNAAHIYSMRKVNQQYTGYACRVRRRYDNAEVDVKFNSDDKISGNCEVVLASSGFGTGIRTDGVHPVRDGESYTGDAGSLGTIYSEDIFSGFAKAPGGKYSTTDSSIITANGNHLYVTKWYDQGIGINLTGKAVTEGLGGDVSNMTASNLSFGRDLLPNTDAEKGAGPSSDSVFTISGAITGNLHGGGTPAYANFFENDGFSALPVYTRVEGSNEVTIHAHDWGTTNPFGLRWVITSSTAHHGPNFNNDKATTELKAYSNSNITVANGYRPSDYSSWTIKLNSNTSFDTSSTITWERIENETNPIIGFSGNLNSDSNGNVSPLFKGEGNPSKLGTESIIDLNTGTVSSVVKVSDVDSSIGMIWQIGTGESSVVTNSTNNTSAFLSYGQISTDTAFTYNTRFSGASGSASLFGESNSLFSGVTQLITGNSLTDEQRNTKINNIIVHDKGTGESVIFNGTGVNVSASNITGKFGQGVLHVGCDANALTGTPSSFAGDIYEVFAFDNDPKDTDSEEAKYTGQIATYYGIE